MLEIKGEMLIEKKLHAFYQKTSLPLSVATDHFA